MEIINASAIMKKKKTIPEDKVQGRSYTSNATKLLKHMDRLQIIQDGGRPKPVMFHMSPDTPPRWSAHVRYRNPRRRPVQPLR
jgi:hypothetical protein